MIGFWIVAGLLVLAVLTVLLRPLLRDPGRTEDGVGVVGMFRRQLADIDSEAEQGRLTPETAVAARTEITRRMLATADRASAARDLAEAGRREFSWRIGTAVGLAGLLPIAAVATYFAVGTPAAIDVTQLAAGDPHSAAEFTAAVGRLTARLQRDPKNVEDWVMLARTSAFLGRFGEAREAYGHAIALAPDRTGLHAELGEILVLEAQGVVTPAAQAEFAKTPDDPRARYYEAQAALQHGDRATATRILQKLLAEAPANASWRKFVAQRLTELAPGAAPATATASARPSAAGPTARDIAAARAMSPQQREAMIRGMVARLAQRLEQHPDDKTGWARVARAYDVLGETDKAKAARARETAAGGPAPPAPR